MNIKEFAWTDPAPPNSGVTSFYDHVIATTALGEFKIEWKSWKQYESYCLYFADEYVESLYSLDEAKRYAYTWLNDKVRELF